MADKKESWLKVRSKNGGPGKRSRVYFTCHEKDFDLYFESVCKQIFQTQDCSIFYTEDMSAESETEYFT